MAISLRARVVFPVDRPAIEHGVVTIEGERIVAVGAKPQASDLTDLGTVALLPGLVNAHTHLEFSDLRQPVGTPGMPFVDWIRLVIAKRSQYNPLADAGILRGLTESWFAGVTSIADIMQRFAEGPTGEAAEADLLTLLLEVIGFSRARADSAYAAAVGRLDELAARFKSRVGISPHAPYSVSPALFETLIRLANGRSLLVATHLAESEEEMRFLRDGDGPFRDLLEERSMWDTEAIPRGSRPLDYLRMLAEAPRALVIHGNYLDEEERAFLAAHASRMSLVYCPRTHAYFRHAPYPLPELLAAGVRVALGTDSRASNPDLDLMEEMRHVAKEFPTINPHEILRLGTLSGAEALGRANDVGSITPGKMANMVAVPLPDDADGSPDDLLGALLAKSSDQHRMAWLRGEKVTLLEAKQDEMHPHPSPLPEGEGKSELPRVAGGFDGLGGDGGVDP